MLAYVYLRIISQYKEYLPLFKVMWADFLLRVKSYIIILSSLLLVNNIILLV
jgi:hypothetical protein